MRAFYILRVANLKTVEAKFTCGEGRPGIKASMRVCVCVIWSFWCVRVILGMFG